MAGNRSRSEWDFSRSNSALKPLKPSKPSKLSEAFRIITAHAAPTADAAPPVGAPAAGASAAGAAAVGARAAGAAAVGAPAVGADGSDISVKCGASGHGGKMHLESNEMDGLIP